MQVEREVSILLTKEAIAEASMPPGQHGFIGNTSKHVFGSLAHGPVVFQGFIFVYHAHARPIEHGPQLARGPKRPSSAFQASTGAKLGVSDWLS